MPPKLTPTEQKVVEEFKQSNIYKTARVSGYGRKLEDWLTNLLLAHRAEKEEAVAEARREAYQHAEIVRQRSLNELREELESK